MSFGVFHGDVTYKIYNSEGTFNVACELSKPMGKTEFSSTTKNRTNTVSKTRNSCLAPTLRRSEGILHYIRNETKWSKHSPIFTTVNKASVIKLGLSIASVSVYLYKVITGINVVTILSHE